MATTRHDDVSLETTERIGKMLIPHFRDAMREDLNALHAKLDKKADSAEVQSLKGDVAAVRSDVTNLKAHSGIWGAFGGVLTSLVTALPSMLGKAKLHPLSVLFAWFRGH